MSCVRHVNRRYERRARSVGCHGSASQPVDLCDGMPRPDVRLCRVAGLDWRLGRVYFLAFLNPSRGQPDPALTARLASLSHRRRLNDGTRLIYPSCRVSRACSSRIGPYILLMLPQPDQDLEQRAVSLQPADDGLRVGPEVMPVSSVTLSDGHGRENARRPVLGRRGELGACPPWHADSVDPGCLHRATCGLGLSVASSGKGQCYRQGLVHVTHGGR